MKKIKNIVEKHPDGYVAYPLGWRGVAAGQGDGYEDALEGARSARLPPETFGAEVLRENEALDLGSDNAARVQAALALTRFGRCASMNHRARRRISRRFAAPSRRSRFTPMEVSRAASR